MRGMHCHSVHQVDGQVNWVYNSGYLDEDITLVYNFISQSHTTDLLLILKHLQLSPVLRCYSQMLTRVSTHWSDPRCWTCLYTQIH